MNMKHIRCQYTPEGIKTFKKQRLGYVVGKGRNSGLIVRWDGMKSTSNYAEYFIDTNPLLALYSDDEIEKIKKESEPVITPEAIFSIEKNLRLIQQSGLTEKGIVVLLRDYIGTQHINKKQIEAVLKALPRLKSEYLVPLPTNNR